MRSQKKRTEEGSNDDSKEKQSETLEGRIGGRGAIRGKAKGKTLRGGTNSRTNINSEQIFAIRMYLVLWVKHSKSALLRSFF
jgi:hypothetical protein